jgi:hypothetical protein
MLEARCPMSAFHAFADSTESSQSTEMCHFVAEVAEEGGPLCLGAEHEP